MKRMLIILLLMVSLFTVTLGVSADPQHPGADPFSVDVNWG